MAKWQFAAQSYMARSLPLLAQRCLNMFVERSPASAKEQVPVYMCPGLTVFSNLGTGPVNALHIMAGVLYALAAGALYSINSDGLATRIGQTNLGGIVSTADNETQLVMVDGETGWVYQPGGLNQILTETATGFVMTSLTALANPGDTTITVADASRFASGDSIGVLLDGGGLFLTTTSGAPTGNVVPLTDPITAIASPGAGVFDYTQGSNTITVASIGTISIGQSISVALDNGTSFSTTITGVSGPASALVLTLTAGLPSQASLGAIAVVAGVVLGQITAPAFMPAATVIYFDDYFIFDARGTNQFFLSALGDGTQYNGLDFASAQANPDYVLAVVNFHEQLLIYGGTSVEVWYDAGALNFPFQRFDGAYIQRGLASAVATCQEDNTVFWLGDDGIFYRLVGYSPVRISTFGTEHAWAQYPTIKDASTFVITMEGHKFIFLTFAAGNATWCYDVSTGQEEPLWHERQSLGSPWVT